MANYGLLDMPNTDPWRGVLSDPRSAYRTQYAEPQPQPIVTPDSRAGRTPESYGLMGNQAPRPAPWEISSGLAETLSPMVQGYGAGQMASYAKDAFKDADFGTAAGSAILAGAGMMPMAGKGAKAPVARAVDPLGYYSGALEAANGLRQAKGTPEQMLSQLRAGGAKQAEIEANGLDKFLQGKSGSTTQEPTGIRAYHGSPHDFDKFDISKIGTGEGAQAYGHGLYFAEQEGVAKSYRDKLGNYDGAVQWKGEQPPTPLQQVLIDKLKGADDTGSAMTVDKLKTELMRTARYADQSYDALGHEAMKRRAADMRAQIAELDKIAPHIEITPPGRMYEVNIKADPNHFLDWDKPLSQQSEKVRGAIETTLGWKPPASAVTDVELAALEQQSHTARKAYDDMRKSYFEDAWKNPEKSETRFSALPEAYRLQSDILKSHDAINDVLRAREMDTGKGIVQKYIDYRGSGKTQGAASENVSRQLREAGIPGIRYLDQGSRGAGEGSRNYVVFDPATIEIMRKYGLMGPMAGGVAAGAATQQPRSLLDQ